MEEKKRDLGVVKEAIGDPAFYNDQIDSSKEPIKARMQRKAGMGDKKKKPTGSISE